MHVNAFEQNKIQQIWHYLMLLLIVVGIVLIGILDL